MTERSARIASRDAEPRPNYVPPVNIREYTLERTPRVFGYTLFSRSTRPTPVRLESDSRFLRSLSMEQKRTSFRVLRGTPRNSELAARLIGAADPATTRETRKLARRGIQLARKIDSSVSALRRRAPIISARFSDL